MTKKDPVRKPQRKKGIAKSLNRRSPAIRWSGRPGALRKTPSSRPKRHYLRRDNLLRKPENEDHGEGWTGNDLDGEDEGTPHRELQIALHWSASRIPEIIFQTRHITSVRCGLSDLLHVVLREAWSKFAESTCLFVTAQQLTSISSHLSKKTLDKIFESCIK